MLPLIQAGPAYAEAFLTVLRNVTKEDTVQYVLAVLDQLLAGKSPIQYSHFSSHELLFVMPVEGNCDRI